MDATPTPFGPHGGGLAPPPGAARALAGDGMAGSIGRKWSALHEAADTVGTIAGLGGEPLRPEVRRFPALIRDAGGWRRELAEQGIEDLTAIMKPGVTALLAALARGASPVAAAQALWREFIAARDALLTLVPPPER